MAVFILILILLLKREADANEEFAAALLDALQASASDAERQDDVEEWVKAVFDLPGCELQFDPETRRLTFKAGAETELYATSRTALSRSGRKAMKSCAESFLTLGTCLSDDEELKELCDEMARSVGKADAGGAEYEGDLADPSQFLADVEALVLEGNTDRELFRGAPDIIGVGRVRKRTESTRIREAYIGNAELGAERARQAVGHLLFAVENQSSTHEGFDGSRSAEVMKGVSKKLRIETTSIGTSWGPCPDNANCPEARNLSLRLRLKQKSLRRPFLAVKKFFCAQYRDQGSALAQGLEGMKRGDEAAKLCAGVEQ